GRFEHQARACAFKRGTDATSKERHLLDNQHVYHGEPPGLVAASMKGRTSCSSREEEYERGCFMVEQAPGPSLLCCCASAASIRASTHDPARTEVLLFALVRKRSSSSACCSSCYPGMES